MSASDHSERQTEPPDLRRYSLKRSLEAASISSARKALNTPTFDPGTQVGPESLRFAIDRHNRNYESVLADYKSEHSSHVSKNTFSGSGSNIECKSVGRDGTTVITTTGCREDPSGTETFQELKSASATLLDRLSLDADSKRKLLADPDVFETQSNAILTGLNELGLCDVFRRPQTVGTVEREAKEGSRAVIIDFSREPTSDRSTDSKQARRQRCWRIEGDNLTPYDGVTRAQRVRDAASARKAMQSLF